jgi:hypothetical protein
VGARVVLAPDHVRPSSFRGPGCEARARDLLGHVKDLVAGSGTEFADRGTVQLKGIPGDWRLYAVASTVGALAAEVSSGR